MALQFLQDFRFQVGVSEDGKDFKYTGECGTTVPLRIELDVVSGLCKQGFQTQKRPYSFIKRVFVEDLTRHWILLVVLDCFHGRLFSPRRGLCANPASSGWFQGDLQVLFVLSANLMFQFI